MNKVSTTSQIKDEMSMMHTHMQRVQFVGGPFSISSLTQCTDKIKQLQDGYEEKKRDGY